MPLLLWKGGIFFCKSMAAILDVNPLPSPKMLMPTEQHSGNLFQAIPSALPEEITETLIQSDSLRIERIISKGHCSVDGFWYDQEQSEWVLVVQGAARLEFEDHAVSLKAGDYVNIPAHVKHRVAWTTPETETIWLVFFY